MEQTLRLKPSRKKWLLLGATFILLAASFLLMYAYSPTHNPPDDSLLVVGSLVVFFLAGAVLSFMNLLPHRAYLLLTPTGFTVRTLFSTKSFRWGGCNTLPNNEDQGVVKRVEGNWDRPLLLSRFIAHVAQGGYRGRDEP